MQLHHPSTPSAAGRVPGEAVSISRRISQRHWFILIIVASFAVRLVLASFAPHPGISDPNHYYNLARNLAAGRGFVIDYVWQYHRPPDAVTHPEDYWMPLPAVWPAVGLRLLGGTLLAALIPSAILGSLIPVLTYSIAAAAGLDGTGRLMAMAMTAFLPEFVLNAVRTDTTISYVLFAGGASLCFYLGLRDGRLRWLLLAGVFGGLAHLSRQDAILLAPAMTISAVMLWRWGRLAIPWRWLWLVPLAWGAVVFPWLWRNYTLFGAFFSSGVGRTMFMTSFNDQFSYGRTLDLQHYLAWGWPNIIGNIALQMLAALKTSYTVLDIALPVTTLMALGGLILRRERSFLRPLVMPFVLVVLLFVTYTMIVPFHGMGGSFKKSYMALIPFLAAASSWGLLDFMRSRWLACVAAGLIAVFMLLDAVELTRADFDAARRYDATIVQLCQTLNSLGDDNADGKITVMTQDPFMLNYHGFPAVMIPSDDRDTIIEVAHRYAVDYIILPAARPALDSLFHGSEVDPRLPLVASSANYYEILAVRP